MCILAGSLLGQIPMGLDTERWLSGFQLFPRSETDIQHIMLRDLFLQRVVLFTAVIGVTVNIFPLS
jgi:hypothetical protein